MRRGRGRGRRARGRRPTGGRSLGQVMRSLRNPNSEIMIRLSGMIFVTTTSAGGIAGYVPTNPASSGLSNSEYLTYWQYLYGEIKLHAFTCTFMPNLVETKGSIGQGSPLAIASSLNSASPPVSYENVLDNADSKIYNFLNDTSARGYTHRFRTGGLSWGSIANPESTGASGSPGSIGFFGTGYTASEQTALAIRYEGFYRLRNRL